MGNNNALTSFITKTTRVNENGGFTFFVGVACGQIIRGMWSFASSERKTPGAAS
jgi:hypothetical protein